MSASSSADRNLIFGLLALQMDSVPREQLLEAMHDWMLDKHSPLGQILCRRGVLDADERHVLDLALAKHVQRHGNPRASLAAFRIFGGLLLFLMALEMVFARESGTRTSSSEAAESRRRADISVFPLAFPFIAGPGALATILLTAGEAESSPLEFAGLLIVVALVLIVCWVLMLATPRLIGVLGVTGAAVVSRLSGVVLAALAVQFIVDGIHGSFS